MFKPTNPICLIKKPYHNIEILSSTNLICKNVKLLKDLIRVLKRIILKKKTVIKIGYNKLFIMTKKSVNSRMGKGKGSKMGTFFYLSIGNYLYKSYSNQELWKLKKSKISANLFSNKLRCIKLSILF